MIIQIYNNKITYIEKKGYESRNQSVIDLLYKTMNYKKLPNVQFIIFTNDYIPNNNLINYPFLLTFCKNNNYKTNLFPNFNFNHWKEANIPEYEEIYNKFKNNQVNWNNKKDIIFWSGSNTNIIRNKIYNSTKNNDNYLINLINVDNNKYIPLDTITEYKYLLNMNGYSYGGRLNYLFLSGSCVIILKNNNKNLNFEEYFYNKFIPNVDYIEILYDDNEDSNSILKRIEDSIINYDSKNIALNAYTKAIQLFNMNNIYDYIYDLLYSLSTKNKIDDVLHKNITYVPSLSNHYLINRLTSIDNNINFSYSGNDILLNIMSVNNTSIYIKFINNKCIVLFDNKEIYNKQLQSINTIQNINQNVNQVSQNKFYKIFINKDYLNIIIDFPKIISRIPLPIDYFVINSINIMSEKGGWLLY